MPPYVRGPPGPHAPRVCGARLGEGGRSATAVEAGGGQYEDPRAVTRGSHRLSAWDCPIVPQDRKNRNLRW